MLARADESVLVVVDVQKRLAGAMEAGTLSALVRNTRILVEAAKLLGVPVLVTEQYPKGLGPTIEPLEEVLGVTTRIEKTRFSAAGELPRTGRGQMILAGMEAHVCVLQTALELAAAGQEVFVVEDACCSRLARNHANAMKRLRAGGVVVTNTESVVFEWLGDARNPHFKAISALVR